MVVRHPGLLTAADFDNFIADHVGDEIYEFVDGEVVQVPSNPWVSNIAGIIFSFIWLHLRQNGLPDNIVSGADGGYMVNGQRFAPDVAVVSPGKRLADQGYNPDPPDLAVEVVSNEDNRQELSDLAAKLPHYRAAGVTVWVVLPRARRAEIHAPDTDASQPPLTLGPDDVLQVPSLLPGFQFRLRDIFSD